jgi:hypothetical protein
MTLFECGLCGHRVETSTWPRCSRGHREFGMYEILRLGALEVAGLWQPKTGKKNTPKNKGI